MTSAELIQWLQALGWEFVEDSDGSLISEEDEINEDRLQDLINDLQNEGLELHPSDIAWAFLPLSNFKGIILNVDLDGLPELSSLKSYPVMKQLAQIEEEGSEVKPDAPEVLELEKRGLVQLSGRTARPTERGKKAKEANPARRRPPENLGGGQGRGRPGGSGRS